MNITKLNSNAANFNADLQNFVLDSNQQDEQLSITVAKIIANVRKHGDQAVLDYSRDLDDHSVNNMAELCVSQEQLASAFQEIPTATRTALEQSATRIRAYAERQRVEDWYWEEGGIRVGQKVTPLDLVGLYIPGGKAIYPSSVLMTAIPAQVAGVPRIAVALSSPQGQLSSVVLAALHLCKIEEVYMIGGAQAIAAFAYGTETIPRVSKIAGPGNRYVTEAKRQVFGAVGIDMLAGPSEIVVLADNSCDPEWIAADLLSQAEHDQEARAILIDTDPAHINAVEQAIAKILTQMPRAEIIRESLSKHGVMIQVSDLAQGAEVVNSIAPEHLELMVADPQAILQSIKHAGAIFMGRYACEALGDYCAGPSHVLPTSSAARFSSPLGVYDFQKRSSIIDCNEQGADKLSHIAQHLAEQEGLFAHALSAQRRAKE